jgi:hypothetical protein
MASSHLRSAGLPQQVDLCPSGTRTQSICGPLAEPIEPIMITLPFPLTRLGRVSSGDGGRSEVDRSSPGDRRRLTRPRPAMEPAYCLVRFNCRSPVGVLPDNDWPLVLSTGRCEQPGPALASLAPLHAKRKE